VGWVIRFMKPTKLIYYSIHCRCDTLHCIGCTIGTAGVVLCSVSLLAALHCREVRPTYHECKRTFTLGLVVQCLIHIAERHPFSRYMPTYLQTADNAGSAFHSVSGITNVSS